MKDSTTLLLILQTPGQPFFSFSIYRVPTKWLEESTRKKETDKSLVCFISALSDRALWSVQVSMDPNKESLMEAAKEPSSWQTTNTTLPHRRRRGIITIVLLSGLVAVGLIVSNTKQQVMGLRHRYRISLLSTENWWRSTADSRADDRPTRGTSTEQECPTNMPAVETPCTISPIKDCPYEFINLPKYKNGGSCSQDASECIPMASCSCVLGQWECFEASLRRCVGPFPTGAFEPCVP